LCCERVIIQDVEIDPSFAPHRKIAAETGFRAVQSTPLFNYVGEPLGIVSTHFKQPHRPSERVLRLTDLYIRQAANVIAFRLGEQRLRESEARLQSAVDLVKLGLYAWDPRSKALDWDATVKSFWGLPADAHVDYDIWHAALHPDDRERVLAAVKQCTDPQGDGVHDVEYRVIGADGVERWVATRGRTTFKNGKAVRFTGVALDVTDRKRAVEAIRQSEARLLATLQQFPGGVGLIDRQGSFILRHGDLAKLWSDVIPARDPELARRWRAFDADRRPLQLCDYPAARALRGETVVPGTDFLHTAEDERETWIRVTAAPFRNAAGEIDGAVAILQNVDAEKRAEQAKELLIAELQHRTRNLLAVVSSLAAETLASSPSLNDFSAAFTSRLGALSRVQSLLSRVDAQPVTIDALVRLELHALGAEPDSRRIVVAGPAVALPKTSVQILALAVHELATNARKYGALARQDGRLAVTWDVKRDAGVRRLILDWHESGIETRMEHADRRRGFGRRLIEEALPYQLGAQTKLEFAPNAVRCSVAMELECSASE
jgi:PAS domain S-box-containing protein